MFDEMQVSAPPMENIPSIIRINVGAVTKVAQHDKTIATARGAPKLFANAPREIIDVPTATQLAEGASEIFHMIPIDIKLKPIPIYLPGTKAAILSKNDAMDSHIIKIARILNLYAASCSEPVPVLKTSSANLRLNLRGMLPSFRHLRPPSL